jgi:hypothetical protein
MAFVAVGYPGWPTPTQSWDWWPLVGIALALWFIRSVLGRALGPIVLVVSLVAGLVFASVVHTWGVPGGAGITLILVASALAHRRRTLPPV